MTSRTVILDRERALARARDLCAFIDAGPMPHQAAAECLRRLVDAGYEVLDEADAWNLEPGRGYVTHRNGTTVMAFRLGSRAPSISGVACAGAHLDSPNIRVKPHANVGSCGYRQLAVEVYGGPILATWTDRDLGIAGRVVVQGRGGLRDGVESRLVNIARPVCRVANVAIHLNRTVNEEGLRLDRQTQLPPLLGLDDTADGESRRLRDLLARELGVAADDMVDFDLGLYDVTPATLGGVEEEFVFAPRLDNLGSSHAVLSALLAATARTPAPPERSWLAVLYDHEECGSASTQGARGTFLADTLRRMAVGHPGAGPNAEEEEARTAARSFLVSADMAHAVHPNYAELHEPGHHPHLNAGPVIKRNENQRYATDGESGAVFTALCRAAGFEPQVYSHRSNLPCGSTIGPLSAAAAGVKAVDVGNPMLSMHSVREMAGTYDQDLMIEALTRLYD